MKDEEKIHFIQEIKLNYFFDDKPAVLETLIGKPINVYAKTTSYNQHLNIPLDYKLDGVRRYYKERNVRI